MVWYKSSNLILEVESQVEQQKNLRNILRHSPDSADTSVSLITMMKPVICLLAACALLGLPVQLQALPTAQTNEVADIEAVNVYCPQRPGLGYSVAAALGWLQYISPGFFFDLRCTHTATVITIRTAITVVNVGIENRYGRGNVNIAY